jgi:hypothetical protein
VACPSRQDRNPTPQVQRLKKIVHEVHCPDMGVFLRKSSNPWYDAHAQWIASKLGASVIKYVQLKRFNRCNCTLRGAGCRD